MLRVAHSPSEARRISANSMLGLQVAFSPTGCSSIQISEDGKVKWNSMRYTLEDPASNIQGGRFRSHPTFSLQAC